MTKNIKRENCFMITAKKIHLILLTPALLAIIVLSGCFNKTSKVTSNKNQPIEKKDCLDKGPTCCAQAKTDNN